MLTAPVEVRCASVEADLLSEALRTVDRVVPRLEGLVDVPAVVIEQNNTLCVDLSAEGPRARVAGSTAPPPLRKPRPSQAP